MRAVGGRLCLDTGLCLGGLAACGLVSLHRAVATVRLFGVAGLALKGCRCSGAGCWCADCGLKVARYRFLIWELETRSSPRPHGQHSPIVLPPMFGWQADVSLNLRWNRLDLFL